MADNFSFPVPNEVLRPYIEQAVSAAVIAALGDGAELVAKAVRAALATKVNSNGTVSKYESDNRHQFVEVVASNKIREVAIEVIAEMAKKMRPQIKESIEKELREKHSELAQALVEEMVTSLTSKWTVKIGIKGD